MNEPHPPHASITNTALANRLARLSGDEKETVTSACDMLMRQMNLDEAAAYALLNEMAEKRHTGLADMSLQLMKVSRDLTT